MDSSRNPESVNCSCQETAYSRCERIPGWRRSESEGEPYAGHADEMSRTLLCRDGLALSQCPNAAATVTLLVAAGATLSWRRGGRF